MSYMKILIFTEGTITMPSSAQGKTREEILQQAETNNPSFSDFRSYIPNGNAVNILRAWKNQGAEIYYLTSRTTPNEIADIGFVLDKFDFPEKENLLFRKDNEEYKDVAEKLVPDILIEDDCESIGEKRK